MVTADNVLVVRWPSVRVTCFSPCRDCVHRTTARSAHGPVRRPQKSRVRFRCWRSSQPLSVGPRQHYTVVAGTDGACLKPRSASATSRTQNKLHRLPTPARAAGIKCPHSVIGGIKFSLRLSPDSSVRRPFLRLSEEDKQVPEVNGSDRETPQPRTEATDDSGQSPGRDASRQAFVLKTA